MTSPRLVEDICASFNEDENVHTAEAEVLVRFIWATREFSTCPDSGMLLYSNGLLRSLVGTGATGTLIAYSSRPFDEQVIPGVNVKVLPFPNRGRAWSMVSMLQSDAYRLKSRVYRELLVRDVSSGPDAIILDYFSTGWTLPAVLRAREQNRSQSALVYIAHNVESVVRRQVASSVQSRLKRGLVMIDAHKAARLERSLVAASDLIVTLTEDDRVQFERLAPGKRIVTIPPGYDGQMETNRRIWAQVPRRVVIAGSFQWIAKQGSLLRFLRAAKNAFAMAGIDVLIVGNAPSRFIADVCSEHKFCRFTGRVRDVHDYLSKGRIGVMPDDVGGGFKLKYLDYVFAGLPIATIRSQMSGLPVCAETDVIAANNTEEMVAKIVECIDDIERLEGMRPRCLQACRSKFNWNERGMQLRRAIDTSLMELQESLR